jgi:uncharacterized protein (TIGR02246 family)
VKTQGSLLGENAAVVLLFSLVASGQIRLRRIDGWQRIAAVLGRLTSVAAYSLGAGVQMSRTVMMAILSVATVGLAVSYTITGSAQSSSGREDEEAIKKVIMEMTEGFNKHDAKAATRMYTPDADLITVRGERYKGAAEMEKGLAAIFATRAKNAVLQTLSVSVRSIRPDVALAHVTNELSGLVSPDGQQLPAHQELSLRVLVKENGTWRVAAFHNTMLRPFGAPAGSK